VYGQQSGARGVPRPRRARTANRFLVATDEQRTSPPAVDSTQERRTSRRTGSTPNDAA
jgi:hypothetical protein